MTVQLIISKFFADSRGWFVESWTRQRYAGYGIMSDFCQDNHSLSEQAGTKPLQTFESGIEATVRWCLDNQAWWGDIMSGAYQGERLGLKTSGDAR
jgi:dTDP-4-dehydrorhamnose 3,5-epimerase